MTNVRNLGVLDRMPTSVSIKGVNVVMVYLVVDVPISARVFDVAPNRLFRNRRVIAYNLGADLAVEALHIVSKIRLTPPYVVVGI